MSSGLDALEAIIKQLGDAPFLDRIEVSFATYPRFIEWLKAAKDLLHLTPLAGTLEGLVGVRIVRSSDCVDGIITFHDNRGDTMTAWYLTSQGAMYVLPLDGFGAPLWCQRLPVMDALALDVKAARSHSPASGSFAEPCTPESPPGSGIPTDGAGG